MSTLTPVSFRKDREHQPRLSKPYVPGRRHERFWTDEEKAIVQDHYAKGGIAGCQAHLPRPRSPSSIYVLAHSLGLRSERLKSERRSHTSSPELDERIRQAWPLLDGRKKGEVGELADQLGVPRWWLSQRARKLHLTMPHKKEPPWTEAESALMAKVPLHDPDKCAEIFRQNGFNRSPTAIVVRAKRLNLSRRTHETLSATKAARLLGVDGKWITAWCISGELKAGRRDTKRLPQQGGDPWAIAPSDLRQFVIDFLDRIDLRKVDKFEFVHLLVGQGGN